MIIDEKKSNNIRLLKMTGGCDSHEVLEELANYAIKEGLAYEGYADALWEREKQFPTGIQAKQGIAIPHADQKYTKKGTLLMALLEQKSEFNEMASQQTVQVEIVFLLLIKDERNQVKVLENIVMLIQDEKQMQALRTPTAILTLENIFHAYM